MPCYIVIARKSKSHSPVLGRTNKDRVHVEEKNWSVVRRTVGYDRWESEEEYQLLQSVNRDSPFVRQLLPASMEAGWYKTGWE